MELDDAPTLPWYAPGEGPGGEAQPYAYVNPAFDALARNASRSPMSAAEYQHRVSESVHQGRQISYVVNAMVSHRTLTDSPELLQRFLHHVQDGLPERYRGRVGVVVAVNGGEKSGTKSEALKATKRAEAAVRIHAAVTAVAAGTSFSLPLALVPTPLDPWPDKFPYGTARNALLVNDANRQALHAFMDQGSHPYVAFMDFDDYPHHAPDGTHVFAQLDRQLRFDEAEEGDGVDHGDANAEFAVPLTDEPTERDFRPLSPQEIAAQPPANLPPLRPYLMSGGYFTPVTPEGKARLLRDTATRVREKNDEAAAAYEKRLADFEKGQAAQQNQETAQEPPVRPTPRTSPNDFNHRDVLKFVHAVQRDMSARDRQAAIAPQLPYSPEPNLFVDGPALLLESNAVEPVRFGTGGGEFHELSEGLMELATWELARELGTGNTPAPGTPARADGYEQDIAPLRSAAENLVPPTRGLAFHTGFRHNATQTDLSRLLAGKLVGALPQDHEGLPNPMNRLFNRAEGDEYTARGEEVRKMRAGLRLSAVRTGLDGGAGRPKSKKAQARTAPQADPLRPLFHPGGRVWKSLTSSSAPPAGEPGPRLPRAETEAPRDTGLGDPAKQRISRAVSRAVPGHPHVWAGLDPTQMRLHAYQLALSDDTSAFLRHMRHFARTYLVRPPTPAADSVGGRLAERDLLAAARFHKPQGSFLAALSEALQPSPQPQQPPNRPADPADGTSTAPRTLHADPLTWNEVLRPMFRHVYLRYASVSAVKELTNRLVAQGTPVNDFFVRLTTGRVHPFDQTPATYAEHDAATPDGLDATARLLLGLYADALGRSIHLTTPGGMRHTVAPSSPGTYGDGGAAPLDIRWNAGDGGWAAHRPAAAPERSGAPGKRTRADDDERRGRHGGPEGSGGRQPKVQRGLSLMEELSLDGDTPGPAGSGNPARPGRGRSDLSESAFDRLSGRNRGSGGSSARPRGSS
ncbi:hypothetical protein [Streptomyces sp. ICC1]|uniref:hypothetical protein n=2 Tax=unclassified Streptomyces TaxID=2593676 RepID=UPI000DC785A5|nr:hypothetical protein [Streptomyces sp. ICC1]AWZ09492.1 hypothetical protein DRB89_39210 [Streptomyces sp. ICC4]AWZ17263.1 hypothetical protein DRB96_39760 [Streptomyces sp. ICC1]